VTAMSRPLFPVARVALVTAAMLLAALATGTSARSAPTAAPAAAPAAAAYPNPGGVTGNITVHDPSMVHGQDGTWYLFSTGNGIETRTSTDRVTFSRAGSVLPGGATWAGPYTNNNTTALWAPDVSFHDGRYYLYYSASTFGSNHSAIGLATSTSARPGTWTDRGAVYTSNTGTNYNAIDPNLVVDSSTGRWWLTFGSFWSGIKMIEIDPATGKQKASNTARTSLAQRPAPDAMEASVIFRHGSSYYLFVSWDTCCRGVNSTYRTMVGRSASITGPYVDRAGRAMTSGGGTEVVATHGAIIGPGGGSVLADTDHDLLVYHYYNGNNNGTPTLGINVIQWDSAGWPVLV
jgi:arabinan endo-1,5-alpha-L-arabinosidase